jgi:calcineurin-like phosphoesterase family protein
MATYFWADTHFYHAGIMKYCNRRYNDVNHMNEDLIARWNARVQDRDTIWLLGDFAFKAAGKTKEDLEILFHRLQGKKCLVIGNHDERNPHVLKLPWERQEKLFTYKWEGRRAELCHYPLETWKRQNGGALMLHGHCHGNLERQEKRRWDVGVDCFDYPVAFDELLAKEK